MKPLATILVIASLLARFTIAQDVERRAPRVESPTESALTLLEQHCVRCHGGEKTKASLNLTTREQLLKGAESGPIIDANKPDASLLLRSIRHESDSHMPYKEKKLSDEMITTIANWVKAGAPYSRALKQIEIAKLATEESNTNHWAFQPITRPSVPNAGSYSNAIDQFIATKLKESNLTLSSPSTREQLIRRVTFDLIGLPPTPAEVHAFASDQSPRAYENLIDRLLTSPHYGERWGRHWLDLVRYAESDGYEHDAIRPNSWRYRDYVIRSFNADKPYDQFIREQIAGDEIAPNDPEALTATAYNLLGPDMVDSSDQIQRRHNTLNDITDTTALTFLGLTLGCARCHDHKFEPLLQKDYYSFQAFFTPAKFNTSTPIPTPAERAAYDRALADYSQNPRVKELAALEETPRKEIFQRKVAKLSPEAQTAHNIPSAERNAEQANLVLETLDKVNITEPDLNAAFTGSDRARRKQLLDEIKKLPKPKPLPQTMSLANEDKPAKAFVLHRGEYSQPEDEVEAAFPVILRVGQAPRLSRLAPRQPRSELANWLASPNNPLTARVMVNRIWQHHFGRGLVPSPSNFGTHGQPPTHPELLDYLASEFIREKWSIKQMHKLMLTSLTYQQTTLASPIALHLDPENKLYSRMNRLRLEGEAIRDSLLAISGELKTDMGGPGVFPPIPRELFQGATGWPAKENDPNNARRSIYIFARRNLRFPFLEVFDAPDTNLSCPAREHSTTAPQSLTLLNSEEVMRASKLTAQSLSTLPQATQINQAYELILNRQPTPKELTLAHEFLNTSPLQEFCRALFNLNDFVYVE
jgi:cytochrome c553